MKITRLKFAFIFLSVALILSIFLVGNLEKKSLNLSGEFSDENLELSLNESASYSNEISFLSMEKLMIFFDDFSFESSVNSIKDEVIPSPDILVSMLFSLI